MFGLTPYGKKTTSLGRFEDPFRLDHLFQSLLNDSQFPFYANHTQIKVDISENEKDYTIEAELPGYKKEEINIELEDDRLTITAQKNEQMEEKGEYYLRRERRYGSVSRSFLVKNINTQAVSAKFENGLLSIVLPKMELEGKKGTKIDIE